MSESPPGAFTFIFALLLTSVLGATVAPAQQGGDCPVLFLSPTDRGNRVALRQEDSDSTDDIVSPLRGAVITKTLDTESTVHAEHPGSADINMILSTVLGIRGGFDNDLAPGGERQCDGNRM